MHLGSCLAQHHEQYYRLMFWNAVCWVAAAEHGGCMHPCCSYDGCIVERRALMLMHVFLTGCSGEGAAGITFESIHGKDTHTIRAADLKLDRFLTDADRQAAAASAGAAEQLPAQPEVVLLTGANGFLGRFLLLDLLQRVAAKCAPMPPLALFLSGPFILQPAGCFFPLHAVAKIDCPLAMPPRHMPLQSSSYKSPPCQATGMHASPHAGSTAAWSRSCAATRTRQPRSACAPASTAATRTCLRHTTR